MARPDQIESLARLEAEIRGAGGAAPWLGPAQAIACLPVLRPAYLGAALLDAGALAIDVHALLQGYLRMLRAAGGAIAGEAEVTGLERRDGLWHASTRAGSFAAPSVVNAAGAWADSVAALAGLSSLGLTPLRRSVLTFAAPEGLVFADWPMLVDIDEQFYLKPEAGRFLLSPADETPSPPCDAQPEELDLAIAIDRLEQATTLTVRRISHRWAGLRTFAPDRTPVLGFDPRAEGFFWLAGQGGYGIQTSAALGQAAAALLLDRPPPLALAEEGVPLSALDPARFAAGAERATPPSS